MARKRPYSLLCPIARALDVLGDRWTLLMLRDLHAGPARFGELQRGLGMAANLLTQRLNELLESGLIQRTEVDGATAYALTDLGRQSDLVLWELSRFGAALPPEAKPRPAGNLRTVALPLRMLLEQAPDRPVLRVRLLIDGEPVVVVSDPDQLQVHFGDAETEVELTLATDYPSFLAAGEGRMTPESFVAQHLEVIDGAQHLGDFLAWFGRAIDQQQGHGV